jgi:lipopolysaccharide transport system ATP-binding protein
MSSDIAVRVTNIGKCYHIYDNPRDRLKQFVLPKVKSILRGELNNYYREFWALKDMSFEVKRGEVVGIIGCNGSGKSTLLQIICGTLTPTNGKVETFGRVAALLELGSGFNPDFTGRENVYMNAAILGLRKEEIDARFDEIVSFADIGDFIEQPVKTYSSGMFIRLAFAVVINVDPDILMIDEALAVGDAKFQLKCFRKLEEIRDSGTTILFVTHDTSTVKSFCSRAMLLNHGCQVADGEPKNIVMQYFDILFPKNSESVENEHENINEEDNKKTDNDDFAEEVIINPSISDRNFGLGGAILEYIKIKGINNGMIFTGGERVSISAKYKWDVNEVLRLARENSVSKNLIMGVSLSDNKGTYLFGCTTYDKNIHIDVNSDLNEVIFLFDMPHLQEGKYFINAAFALGTQEAHVQLCWYDGLVELQINSSKKYIYGLFYNEYNAYMKGWTNSD